METVYMQNLLVTEAQIKSLQAQINPHFLYNTLDCINSLVDLNRLEDTKRSIIALAKIMRMSMKGNNLLTIQEEADYISQYLNIQKIRFENRILFLVDIPESLYCYTIPKLCIQPLIENSIIHGLSDSLELGLIQVQAEEREESICFYVKDNGTPIPSAVIKNLQQEDTPNPKDIGQSYSGIMNIQKRLHLLYGKEYGIHVKRNKTGGNTVIVIIPKQKEAPCSDEDHDH